MVVVGAGADFVVVVLLVAAGAEDNVVVFVLVGGFFGDDAARAAAAAGDDCGCCEGDVKDKTVALACSGLLPTELLAPAAPPRSPCWTTSRRS